MPAPQSNFVPLTLNEILDEELDAEERGKVRKIKMSNGNILTFTCEDPYGFWVMKLSKGRLPEKLMGAYTTFDAALKDANLWMKDKKEPLVYVTEERKKKTDYEPMSA